MFLQGRNKIKIMKFFNLLINSCFFFLFLDNIIDNMKRKNMIKEEKIEIR